MCHIVKIDGLTYEVKNDPTNGKQILCRLVHNGENLIKLGDERLEKQNGRKTGE